MTNLFKLDHGKVNALVGKFAEAGLTAELGEAILKDPSLVRVGVEVITAAVAEAAKYAAILAAAIARCGCNYDDGELAADAFGPDIFGTLGEGYVLGEPMKSAAAKKRGHWLRKDFDAWLAGPEVAGNGLEAAYLADLCEYGHDNPEVQIDTPVLCWRPNQNGRVVCLSGSDDGRSFCVDGLVDDWGFHCRVLLRRVHQS